MAATASTRFAVPAILARMTDLNHTQQQELAGRLRELEAQLGAALEDAETSTGTVELDQTRVGRVSRGDALQQQAMAQAGRRVMQRRLNQVRAALARMQRGDYGYCLDCEEPIAPARLQRQPEAALCLRCQEAREG